jgi:hypothetical protein
MLKSFCVIFTIRILWFTEFFTIVKASKFEVGAALTSVGADILNEHKSRIDFFRSRNCLALCVRVHTRVCVRVCVCVGTTTVNVIQDILALLRRQLTRLCAIA